ncbi:hypothetical protein VBD025_13340 [Virgibacillus flavescens]|uniref:hypothetical protein n=1 Tax=Virgibacillus flavescens TaxID=1611422 RepID=UPI003D35384F
MNFIVSLTSVTEVPYGLLSLIGLGILICYLSVKPLIKWIINLKQERVLRYVLCSLIILHCTIFIGYVYFQIDYVYLIKVTSLCIALFGGVLVMLRLLHYVYQLIFTKSA